MLRRCRNASDLYKLSRNSKTKPLGNVCSRHRISRAQLTCRIEPRGFRFNLGAPARRLFGIGQPGIELRGNDLSIELEYGAFPRPSLGVAHFFQKPPEPIANVLRVRNIPLGFWAHLVFGKQARLRSAQGPISRIADSRQSLPQPDAASQQSAKLSTAYVSAGRPGGPPRRALSRPSSNHRDDTERRSSPPLRRKLRLPFLKVRLAAR